MAFLRFTRDKRGYEYFALVHPTTNRRGKVRTRVLYWYRTPPEVKVGREPFDAAMRQALETQNPDVTFDWKKILETPIPSAETERWRERRRAEKAEKAARRAEAAEEASAAAGDAVEHPEEGGLAPQQDDSTSEDAEEAVGLESDQDQTPNSTLPDTAAVVAATSAPPVEGHRRRRRRGRRGQTGPPLAGVPMTPDAALAPPVERSEPGEPLEPIGPTEPE